MQSDSQNIKKSVGQAKADRTRNITAKQDAALLGTVYRTVTMGAGAAEGMLRAAQDPIQRDRFMKSMKDYRAVEAAALGRLHRLHEAPDDVGAMTKLMSTAGMKLNTALNASPTRLAEMATQSAGVGIDELRDALARNPQASQEARHIAEAVINMETQNISGMKNYL